MYYGLDWLYTWQVLHYLFVCQLGLNPTYSVGPKVRGHRCETRYFWKTDVLDMGHKFKQLGIAGGSQAIRDFRLARKELVRKAMKVASR